jgi:hypothetical protein
MCTLPARWHPILGSDVGRVLSDAGETRDPNALLELREEGDGSSCSSQAETAGVNATIDGEVPPSGGVFRLERTSNLTEQHTRGGENHRHAEPKSRVGGEEFHGKFQRSPPVTGCDFSTGVTRNSVLTPAAP